MDQSAHARVRRCDDAAGKLTTYNLELTSPNAIQRLGWNKNDLVAGEKVTFKAHAGKVVESRAALDSLVKANAPEAGDFQGAAAGGSLARINQWPTEPRNLISKRVFPSVRFATATCCWGVRR
jgi:hypothetical protein